MMKVGFTGTRKGMTQEQKESMKSLLTIFCLAEFHHGDCIGADAEAHKIAKSLYMPIVIHPPVNNKARAFCKGDIRPPKQYLVRNIDIVNECHVLIGAPSGNEKVRSGTWSTLRYAKKRKTWFFVVYPTGLVTVDKF